MANKIAMLSFQMNIIIPCHAWAKSKHINPFYIYLPFFQREVPFLPSRYHEKSVLNNVLLKLSTMLVYKYSYPTSFWLLLGLWSMYVVPAVQHTKSQIKELSRLVLCTWRGTSTCNGLKPIHSTEVLKHKTYGLLHFNKTNCWVLRLSFWLSFNIWLLSG